MKKYGVVLAAVLVLLVVPVSMVSARGGQQASGDSDITVAGIVFLEDQFQRLLTLAYQDAARDAGVRCLVANSNNDQGKEVELVNTYLTQGVKGLAIAPCSATSSLALVERAANQGLKVAITDWTVEAPFLVGAFGSSPYDLGAGTGKVAAKFIKEKMGGKAKIALVQYQSLSVEISSARVNGFLDEVKKVNPGVEVIATQDAWMPDRSFQVTTDLLTAYPEIEIIYGANDGGVLGAVQAVKNAGKAGKVFVFGIDAGEQQIAMLKDSDNILQAVTGQDPYGVGYTAMSKVIEAVKGKDVSDTQGKIVVVPGTTISRDDPQGLKKYEDQYKVWASMAGK
jgi:simple sugar transport system substrate-binding protein/ribose transport system substrate-binding protein